jgi:hypothetical protein
MEIQNIVGVVLGMSGFGALVSALVNALKTAKVIKDGQASVWVTGLNLLGVVVLWGFGAAGVTVDLPAANGVLGLFAQVTAAGGELLLSLFGSRLFYSYSKGFPVLGKSYTMEADAKAAALAAAKPVNKFAPKNKPMPGAVNKFAPKNKPAAKPPVAPAPPSEPAV